MSTRSEPLNQCKSYLRALRTYRWLWIVPTVALTLGAAGFAALRPATWRASQAFLVRDEAVSGLSHQGRFDSNDAMKAFQETILELARNRTSVAAALREVGPPPEAPTKQDWPTEELIEEVQDSIKVSAPRGAEFGKTEVIYLSVTGRTRQQALDRTEAVYRHLDQSLADLRNAKARSIVTETSHKLELARRELEAATTRLREVETRVGSDLGELRILNDSGAGDSNLRGSLNLLSAELRQARAVMEAHQQQQQMLVAANRDPDNLLAISSRLFDSQPALRRLKDGLLDAQLRSAELLGKMTENHPQVRSARDTESAVRRDFYAELASSLRGVQADLEVSRNLVESLQRQHDETQQRLNRLAELRAEYSNLVAEVRQRSELVERANNELAAAQASLSAADSASLITRFDAPIIGSSPVGPSRKAILASGLLGGLLVGLGLVFLAMPSPHGRGRRWSDYLGYGRRASDQHARRRAADALPPAIAAAGERRSTEVVAPAGRRADDHFSAQQTRAAEPPASAQSEPAGGVPGSDPLAALLVPPQVAAQAITAKNERPGCAPNPLLSRPEAESGSAEPLGEAEFATREVSAAAAPLDEAPAETASSEPVVAEPELTNQRGSGSPGKPRREGKRSLLAACLSDLQDGN